MANIIALLKCFVRHTFKGTKAQSKNISKEKLFSLSASLHPLYQRIGTNSSSSLQNYIVVMYLAIPTSRFHQIVVYRSLAGNKTVFANYCVWKLPITYFETEIN